MTRQEVFKKMESGLSKQGKFKRRISQYETKYSRKIQDMHGLMLPDFGFEC